MATAAAAAATSLESSTSSTAPTSRVSRRQPKKGGYWGLSLWCGMANLIRNDIDFVVQEDNRLMGLQVYQDGVKKANSIE